MLLLGIVAIFRIPLSVLHFNLFKCLTPIFNTTFTHSGCCLQYKHFRSADSTPTHMHYLHTCACVCLCLLWKQCIILVCKHLLLLSKLAPMNTYIRIHTHVLIHMCMRMCISACHAQRSFGTARLHCTWMFINTPIHHICDTHTHTNANAGMHTWVALHFQHINTLKMSRRRFQGSYTCLAVACHHFFGSYSPAPLATSLSVCDFFSSQHPLAHTHTYANFCFIVHNFVLLFLFILILLCCCFLLLLLFCEITPWSSGGCRVRAQCCQRNCAQFISPCLAPFQHQLRIQVDTYLYVCMFVCLSACLVYECISPDQCRESLSALL